FLQLLNMSITAGWVVLAVMLLRLCFRKAPKWITVLLWGLVAVRLLLPFSIESALSLLPSGETVPHEILQAEKPAIQSGIPSVNAVVNPFLQESFAPTPGNSVNPMQVVTEIAAWVWIVGVAGMMLYFFVSFFLLKRKLREAVLVKENIWACDGVDTPFLLGLFRPRIYLPSFLAEEDAAFVIAHEKAHLKRKDHLWKPLGFLLLAVYWFHPLLWVGYILLCKDIELACDERVLAELGEESKKTYSNALINCSVPRRMISACPLAFGENGVKSRVKSILHYKKPALWILIGAILVTSFAAVWFLTDPLKAKEKVIAWEEIPGMEYEKEDAFLELEAFPGVTFRCSRSKLVALAEEGERVILNNQFMVINGVYFTDLNGDEVPEICVSMMVGSGIIRNVVKVYDYAAGELYSLVDPPSDYCSLCEENDRLLVRYPVRLSGEFLTAPQFLTAPLALEEQNGEICLVMKEQRIEGVVSDESVSVETPSSDNETSLRDPNENEEYVEETPLDESIANWFGWQDLAYVKDIALEEYPGKTFYIGGSREKRWEIRMRDEEEDHLLFRADQIAGAYFMDLNGDGMRELLIWYTLGSSNVSAHVGVYDMVAMEKYEAGVKDEYDCWLTEQSGFLYLEVTPYGREKPISILGTPVLTEENGEVVIDMVDPVAFGRDGTSFPVGRTLYKTTPDAMGLMSSDISLYEDGTFYMCFGSLSSYIGHGPYSLENGQLVLNTADGKYTYRFDVVGDKLVYREEGSSTRDWWADLFDGCIFE
ncbi:MAG: hypothetical protein II325_06725, partial [Clostridia bacterium]|nr:hypothetical protein [Clostridia bacterium]